MHVSDSNPNYIAWHTSGCGWVGLMYNDTTAPEVVTKDCFDDDKVARQGSNQRQGTDSFGRSCWRALGIPECRPIGPILRAGSSPLRPRAEVANFVFGQCTDMKTCVTRRRFTLAQRGDSVGVVPTESMCTP